MKKILNIIILLSLVISMGYSFVYCSFKYERIPFINNNTIIVDKESQLSSDEYIDIMSSASSEYNVFPIFLEVDIVSNNKNKNTYYTDYPGTLPSNYPSFFSTSSTLPFSEIVKFNLNTIEIGLLGEEENFSSFIKYLEEKGLSVTISNYTSESYFRRYNYSAFIALFIFNVVYMYIYILTKKKKYGILKLEGIKTKDVLYLELRELTSVTILYVISIIVFTLMLFIKYEPNFAIYFLKIQSYVTIVYVLFIILSLLIAKDNYQKSSVLNIKNGIINQKRPIVLMVLVVCISFLFLNVSTEFFNTVIHYRKTSEKYEEVSNLYEYSTVPIYSNISDLDYNEKYSDVTTALYNFYFLTQEDLDGTLVSYSAYEDGYIFNVNTNYLSKQKIVDSKNNQLTSDNIPLGITKLVPESNRNEASEPNSIIIKDDQALKYIDNSSGKIKETKDYLFISVVNYPSMEQIPQSQNIDLLDNAIISPMSMENYYIKTNKEDPNSVSAPYIKQAGAENYIRQTPLVGNELLKSLITQQKKMVSYAILLVTITIMEVVLIINANLAIILTMRKKLSIYYLDKQGLPKMLTSVMCGYVVVFFGLGMLSYLQTTNMISIILTFMICILFLSSMIILYKKKIIKNISNNIKGDV